DPLDKQNDLANKKRKHAADIHDYFKETKRLKQDFVTIEDLKDFKNAMLYTVQEIFFKRHQGPRVDDYARTFSSLLLAEVDKRNLNPLKHMRTIKQLRHNYEFMNRSSKKELIEPYNEPEGVLHSLRKLFKTTSFDHSSLLEFKLFSDYEEQVEEEIVETITEPTMEDGSGNEDANEHIERVLEIVDLLATPDMNQDQLILHVFPISLIGAASRCSNTFDGLAAIQAQLNNLGREIKKVNERVYVAQVGYELCSGPHYSKDYPLKEEGKTLEEAYYT
ncbi:hypothetical protein Tco_1087487, partial [Tanacetum coccineum]